MDVDGHGLIFILSTPRAGSTLLAAMLGSHSQIACPPEPWLLLPLHAIMSSDSDIITAYDHNLARHAWRDLVNEDLLARASRSFAAEVYNDILDKAHRNIIVDKTPRYYHILPWLDKIFPRARKVWLQRNPLDILASCKETWGLTVDEMTGTNVTPHTFDTTVSFALLADFFSEESSTRYRFHYEDLVRDPEDQLKSLCAFLGLSFEREMLDYRANDGLMTVYTKTTMGDKKLLAHDRPHTKSIGRWHEILLPEEIKQVVRALGSEVFIRQGYDEVLEDALVQAGLTELDLNTQGKLEQLMTLYSSYVVQGSALPEASQYSRLARENDQLRSHLTECEIDRAVRLQVIERQGQRLGEVEAERNSLRFQLDDLQQQFEAAEADRAARLQVIEEQGRRLGEIEAERNSLRFQLDDLQRQFEAVEADRAADLQVIEEQGQRLGDIETKCNDLQTQLASARGNLQQFQQQFTENEEIRSNQASLLEAQEHQVQVSMAQLRKLQQLVQTIQRGRVYHAVRRLGGWKWFDNLLSE